MLKILKNNLNYAIIYLQELLFVGVIYLVLFLWLPDKLNLPYFLIIAISLFAIIIFLLYSIGKKRREELNTIRFAINSIRQNLVDSPDEIRLGSNLNELESDIKSMFFKSQEDIKNLKKLEKMRTQFLANVSHELRTPIFAIQGYIETLLEGAINDPKVKKSFLEKANLRTLNLNDLLNDLIDISMIESGEMRLSLDKFNIYSFLREICQELNPIAEEKGLELILHTINNDLELQGDKKRLKQVMVNLIQNAIKYTELGKIEVIVSEEKDQGTIIVKDTGIGISKKDVDRIFERFYRVDKDRSREIGGTGLGLAIVKHIIDAHKSKIFVKSVIGKGTEFLFRLKK